MKKIENILTIVLFFAFILGGLVSFIILPDKVFSENENRYLKECPTPKLASITDGSFMEDYCLWWKRLRKRMILKAIIKR